MTGDDSVCTTTVTGACEKFSEGFFCDCCCGDLSSPFSGEIFEQNRRFNAKYVAMATASGEGDDRSIGVVGTSIGWMSG